MDTASASKSPGANWREGVVLTALQALPAFSGSALLLRPFGNRQIVEQPGGAAIFVLLAGGTLALFTAWLGPKYPNRFKNYEPLFFDATLSFDEKIQRWLVKPATARDLWRMVLMLALLAIAVMTVR